MMKNKSLLHSEINLESSVCEKITERNGVEVWIKRDDWIHPAISGNKWRKLKYFVQRARDLGKAELLTFGGAFSNHLLATAAAGKHFGFGTHAIVRGDKLMNPTLDLCAEWGMQLDFISRKKYQSKDDPEFLELLQMQLPNVMLIPEGGKGPLGVKGFDDYPSELASYGKFEKILVAGGTGTTAAGLLLHLPEQKVELYPALKGGAFLARAVAMQLQEYAEWFSTKPPAKDFLREHLDVVDKYHFGGYGKVKPELIRFMNDFYREYQIPLDPVYTGKLMYGLWDRLENGEYPKGSRILVIHTGGLQGIWGMNEQLERKNIEKINYAI